MMESPENREKLKLPDDINDIQIQTARPWFLTSDAAPAGDDAFVAAAFQAGAFNGAAHVDYEPNPAGQIGV